MIIRVIFFYFKRWNSQTGQKNIDGLNIVIQNYISIKLNFIMKKAVFMHPFFKKMELLPNMLLSLINIWYQHFGHWLINTMPLMAGATNAGQFLLQSDKRMLKGKSRNCSGKIWLNLAKQGCSGVTLSKCQFSWCHIQMKRITVPFLDLIGFSLFIQLWISAL